MNTRLLSKNSITIVQTVSIVCKLVKTMGSTKCKAIISSDFRNKFKHGQHYEKNTFMFTTTPIIIAGK
jgi:hypothetical protein